MAARASSASVADTSKDPTGDAEPDPVDEDKVLGEELTLSEDRTELRYYEHAFPVAPGTGEGTPARTRSRFDAFERV